MLTLLLNGDAVRLVPTNQIILKDIITKERIRQWYIKPETMIQL